MTPSEARHTAKALTMLQERAFEPAAWQALVGEKLRSVFSNASPFYGEWERISNRYSATESSESTVKDLETSLKALLQAATESVSTYDTQPQVAPADSDLRPLVEDAFMASRFFTIIKWGAVACIAMLGVALTLFSFGLLRLNDRVGDANKLLNETDAQLRSTLTAAQDRVAKAHEELDTKLSKVDASITAAIETRTAGIADAERQARERMQNTEGAIDTMRRDAQIKIDAIAVDIARGADGQVAKAIDVANQAISARQRDGEHALNERQETALAALSEEQNKAVQAVTSRAMEDIGVPRIAMVIGRAYPLMLGALIVAFLALIVSVVSLIKSFRPQHK